MQRLTIPRPNRDEQTYIRLPSYEKLRNDPVLYAHASRVFHKETNPGNARVLVQRHGIHELWVNPPPIPLETDEMDWVLTMPTSGCRTRPMVMLKFPPMK